MADRTGFPWRWRARGRRRDALTVLVAIAVISPLACRPPVNTGNPPVVTRPWGAIERDVGCLADRSAASLSRFFSQRVGTVMGMDNGHMIPICGDRFLWFFQDAFAIPSATSSASATARTCTTWCSCKRATASP